MHTFPDQINWQFVQILMDSKFRSKLRVLDTDDVKQKTSLFSVQGKSAWYCFMVFCSFVLCHLCLVHKINAQTPITAIPSTYLLHEFIVNVKCRMDGSHGKPYICCRLIFWYNILPMEHVKLRWICRNMSPLSGFFEKVTFSVTYTEIPWFGKLFLQGKELIFLAHDVTHVTH